MDIVDPIEGLVTRRILRRATHVAVDDREPDPRRHAGIAASKAQPEPPEERDPDRSTDQREQELSGTAPIPRLDPRIGEVEVDLLVTALGAHEAT